MGRVPGQADRVFADGWGHPSLPSAAWPSSLSQREKAWESVNDYIWQLRVKK